MWFHLVCLNVCAHLFKKINLGVRTRVRIMLVLVTRIRVRLVLVSRLRVRVVLVTRVRVSFGPSKWFRFRVVPVTG